MLSKKKRYIQIALNSTLTDAKTIISQLPTNDRILLEAGTPLLKTYGSEAIRRIRTWWEQKILANSLTQNPETATSLKLSDLFTKQKNDAPERFKQLINTYIVADYKAMDRGATEVEIAARAGASAITVLGQAPTETVDLLIEECNKRNIDSVVDMMNVDHPYKVLRKLKKLPTVVMLHRGVDETEIGSTAFPIHKINKVKGAFNTLIAIGGGDTTREVQSAVFNGANIVMVWKDFYTATDLTSELVQSFLKEIK